MNKFCAPVSPKPALQFSNLNAHILNGSLGDIQTAAPLLLYSALIAFGLSLVFFILLTCCTRPITYLLMLGVGLLLILMGSLVFAYRFNYGKSFTKFDPYVYKYQKYFREHSTLTIIIASLLILIGLLELLIVCKYRSEIGAAIPMISIATKSSLRNVLLLFISVVILVLQFCIIIGEAYIFLRIYVLGNPSRDKANGYPLVLYETTFWSKLLFIVHGILVYWLLVVLNNFNDYVCSSVTVNYYWTSKIENIRILCHALGHNIGSLAWTFVFLPIAILKVCFGWLDYLTSSSEPNCIQSTTRKILCPFFYLYERLVDVISESSLAIVYLGSEDFWPANKRYYYLAEKLRDACEMLVRSKILEVNYSTSLLDSVITEVEKNISYFLTMYNSY